MTCAEASEQISRAYYSELERRLITAVEIIEGRVPTNDEIALHMRKLVQPGRWALWEWRGVRIVECDWWPEPGIAFRFR